MRTKISIFFIAITFCTFFSCENSENRYQPIPNIRLSIELNQINMPELQSLLIPKYIANYNGKKVGYQGHGIYIVQTSNGVFKAFDASCTYISGDEQHPIIKEHLLPKEKNGLLVYCPKCKTEFNLQYGNKQKGVAKYPLKEYKIRVSGKTIRIFN